MEKNRWVSGQERKGVAGEIQKHFKKKDKTRQLAKWG